MIKHYWELFTKTFVETKGKQNSIQASTGRKLHNDMKFR